MKSFFLFLIACILSGRCLSQSYKSDSLFSIGVSLYGNGQYKKAIAYFEECKQLDEKEMTPESNRRDYSSIWLASCYYKIGMTDKAKSISPDYYWVEPINRILTIASDSLSELALLAFKEKDYPRALRMAEKTINIEKRIVGESHIWYGNSAQLCAILYNELQNVEKTEYYLYEWKRCLKKYSYGGGTYLRYIYCLGDISLFHSQHGQINKAIKIKKEQLFESSHLSEGEKDSIAAIINLDMMSLYMTYGEDSLQVASDYAKEAIRLSTDRLSYEKQLFAAYYVSGLVSIKETDYKKGAFFLEKAKNIAIESNQGNTPDYAHLLIYLFHCYYETHQSYSQYGLLENAKKILEEQSMKTHQLYMECIYEMARYKTYWDDFESSNMLIEKIMPVVIAEFGKSGVYALFMELYAENYKGLGLFDDCIKAQEEVLRAIELDTGISYRYLWSLLDLAKYYQSQGDTKKAIDCCTKGIDILCQKQDDNSDIFERYSEKIAELYASTNQLELSISAYLNAIHSMENMHKDNTSRYAKVVNKVALLYNDKKVYEKAIEYGLIFETKCSELNDSTGLYTSCVNLADYYAEMGNYVEGIKYISKALQLNQDNHSLYPLALRRMAIYHRKLNYNADAIKYALKAYKQTRAKTVQHNKKTVWLEDFVQSATCLSDCYFADSLYNEAIKYAEEALTYSKSFEGGVDYYVVEGVYNTLAKCYYAAGIFDMAEKTGLEMINFTKEYISSDPALYLYRGNEVSNYCIQNKDYSKAADLLDLMIKNYEKDGLFFLQEDQYVNLAQLYFEAEDYQKSIKTYEKVLSLNNNTFQKYGFYTSENKFKIGEVHFGIGLDYILLGEKNKANEQLDSCVSILTKEIPLFFLTADNKSRKQKWEENNGICSIAAPLCWSGYMSNTKAYDALLLSKGILLNSEIEMSKLIYESGDKDLQDKYLQLNSSKEKLLFLCKDFNENKKFEIDSLLFVIKELEKELLALSSFHGNYTTLLYVDWSEVRSNLRQKDIAIEFASFSNSDSTSIFALTLRNDYATPHITKVITLSNCDIDSIINNPFKTEVENIWGTLITEIKDVDNIYFSPSGFLYSISLESLPCPTNNGFMSDYYKMFRLSSTRQLCIKKEIIKNESMVAYGGLDYYIDGASHYSQTQENVEEKTELSFLNTYKLREVINDIPYLEGTKMEINNITHIVNQLFNDSSKIVCYIGEKGTEDTFKSLDGKNISMIHIATHGFYYNENNRKTLNTIEMYDSKAIKKYLDWESQNLMRSGLLLAGAGNTLNGEIIGNEYDDGILTAQEISTLNLRNLNMVVLSACQTAQGNITSEGVFGLQRGFKKAGAQSLLLSLWKVDDEATCLLMTEFYKNWIGEGKTKHDALEQAKQAVRSHKEKGWDDPKYWAAFILLDALD